ncbi:MAG: DUF2442 domain-containing protein [Cyanobacteria bacterium J06635_1]
MTSLIVETITIPQIRHVIVTDEALTVDLSDGRTISAPLAWYPRLLNGSREERNNLRLTGGQEGIHWPDLDEDVSLKNIILGQPSGESHQSFQHWLEQRAAQG